MDYEPLLRRAKPPSMAESFVAIGFADVRSGIPGSSPEQALPPQSGLRRNDEVWDSFGESICEMRVRPA